jgi:hypothetical protein
VDNRPVELAPRGLGQELECQRAMQRVLEAAEVLKHPWTTPRRPNHEVECQRAMRRVLEAAELLKHPAPTTFLSEPHRPAPSN